MIHCVKETGHGISDICRRMQNGYREIRFQELVQGIQCLLGPAIHRVWYRGIRQIQDRSSATAIPRTLVDSLTRFQIIVLIEQDIGRVQIFNFLSIQFVMANEVALVIEIQPIV